MNDTNLKEFTDLNDLLDVTEELLYCLERSERIIKHISVVGTLKEDIKKAINKAKGK